MDVKVDKMTVKWEAVVVDVDAGIGETAKEVDDEVNKWMKWMN